MAAAFRLTEMAKIVELLNPAADAAGRTGQYITCKYAHKVFVVCHLTQGNAATVTFTLSQAVDVSGTSAKSTGINVPYWANEDTSAGTGTDTLVYTAPIAGGSVNSYTTGAGLKNKMVVFEFDPSYLDQANNFKTITVITGASNAANVTEAIAYVIFDRYANQTPPSVILN